MKCSARILIVDSHRRRGRLWNDAERDLLGAWVVSGIACLVLQKLCRLCMDMVWMAPAWLPSMPLPKAVVEFWQGQAYLDLWGDEVILGGLIGLLGYVAQRRGAERLLFASWRGIVSLIVLVMVGEVVYNAALLVRLPVDGGEHFWSYVILGLKRILVWHTFVPSLIVAVALRLVPEVASGLEELFCRIRERYLT